MPAVLLFMATAGLLAWMLVGYPVVIAGLARWRARHVDMVHRMIGLRLGTGGSSGKGYLRGAMDHHYVFKEIADMSSFLFERRKLPALPAELHKAMRFAG